jgi:hypothetical protein
MPEEKMESRSGGLEIPCTYPITAEEGKKLDNNFTYHAPKPGQPERYTLLRGTAKKLAVLMHGHCPRSRELSLAITNLEDAIMWANAAIARNE